MNQQNPNLDLRDEAIEHISINYQGNRLEEIEDITDLTDDIFSLIVKRLDKKIRYCDKCMKEPTVLMEECGFDCLQTKKKTFQEVISMLIPKKMDRLL